MKVLIRSGTIWILGEQQPVQILTEATNVICQRDVKGARFGSWFYSKRPYEAAMDAGTENIGMLQIIQKDYLRITLRK